MSAINVLQTAIHRRRTAFGVEDFLAIALGMLLAIGLIGAYTRFAAPAEARSGVAASAEPSEADAAINAAPPQSGPPAGEPLTPRMLGAMESVSRRYRVSLEAVRPIFEAAQSAGRNLHLDPLLIIAVIGIESGFNPFSESVMGAQGLMQVIPRFHQEKLPEGAGQAALLDPVTNVHVGAQVLKESIRRNGGLVGGLQQFAGAADDPDQRYANRVIAEKQRLEQALLRARSNNG